MIVTKNDKPFFTIGSPGGATIITTVGQTLVNRINLQMPLEDALAAPRASQRNSATTEAESAFVNSPTGQELFNQYGERYRAPAGDEIGALTGIEWKSAKLIRAVAEPDPPRRRLGEGGHTQSVSTGSRERASSTTASASASSSTAIRARWRPPPPAPRRPARRRCRAACRRSRRCARAATAGRRRGRGRSPGSSPAVLVVGAEAALAAARSSARCRRGRA